MNKVLKTTPKLAGSEQTNEPRHIKEILKDCFENSNQPLAAAYRGQLFKDIHPNTELGIDLKLLTRKPGRMQEGEILKGSLTRDGEYHYLFVQETQRVKSVPRNPHVYRGKYINVNRKSDGTLYPTFNRPGYSNTLTFRDFCRKAAVELWLVATEFNKSGLVEKKYSAE